VSATTTPPRARSACVEPRRQRRQIVPAMLLSFWEGEKGEY